MSYDAFISYSHEADGMLAPAVQRGLVRFAKPWFRRRALAVFRDETALSTNPDLWKSIETTLDDTRWFVLLASPAAASSQWVNREVEHWLDVHGADSVLPVVTDGDWEWDPDIGDFREGSSSVPSALRGVFAAEPRQLDLRWARRDTDLDLRDARFRDAIADLAAPMHGRPKDDLAGEDVRQHRRTIRVAWTAGATLAVLLVAALIATGIALQQRSQANAAKRRAETAATASEARGLAAEAISGSHADLARSMLLAVEGYRLLDDTQTRGALLSVAQSSAPVAQLIHGSWDAATLSPDGQSVYAVDADSIVHIDLATRRRRRIGANHFGPVRTAEVSPDGNLLALGGRDVHLFDVRTGHEVRAPLRTGVANAEVNGLRFDPDGSSLAVVTYPVQEVIVWSLPTANEIGRFPTDGVLEAGGIDYSRDGRWLAVAGSPGTVYDAHSLQPRYATFARDSNVERNVSMIPDGTRVVVARFDHSLIRDATTGRSTGVSMGSATPVALLAVDPTGTVVAGASDDGTVTTWDAQSGLPRRAELFGATRPALFLRFASHDRLVEATSAEIIVFDLSAQLGHPLPRAHQDPTLSIGTSSNSRFIASAHLNGTAQIWDLERGTTSDLDHPGTVSSLVFRPKTVELTVGDREGRVTTYDAHSRRLRHPPITLTAANPPSVLLSGRGISSLAYDKTGRTLAAITGAGQVAIVNASTAKVLRRIQLQTAAFVMPVALSPDGKLVATGGPRGIVEATVVGTHRRQLSTGAVTALSLAYSPDGKLLVAGTLDGRVLLLNPKSLQPVAPPLVSNHGAPYGLAFDTSGNLLAVSGATITLWDMASRSAIGTDLTAPSRLLPITFSDTGRTLVAGSEAGEVLRFQISASALQESLCHAAARDLTSDERRQFLPGTNRQAPCPRQ